MRRNSVADALRTDLREELRHTSPSERVALALALARRDLAAYARAQGISVEEARRAQERRRQARRRRSGCIEALIG